MNLKTPNIAEISANVVAQLEAAFGQSVPLLPRSFLRVLAKVLASVFVITYKYGGFMFLQMFVRTASTNETEVNGRRLTPLLEWGRLIGVGDPTPAIAAELLVSVTVEQAGGTLPAGSQLVSASGVVYVTTEAHVLEGSAVLATVRALSDPDGGAGLGSVGNLPDGSVLSFASPLAGVAREATVAGTVTTGTDREPWNLYRQRVIDRFQKRPQGGAYTDYEEWAETVAGIANAYPYTGLPGRVSVYVEATPDSSGDPDGIPTQAQLDAVDAAIQRDRNGKASRRPLGARVDVFPITRRAFEVRVTGLDVDGLAAVRADIEAAVKAYFAAREPYIAGLSVPPRRDRIDRIVLTSEVQTIVTAAGGVFTGLELTLDGSVVDSYILGEGEKAKAEAVTWI